MSFSTSSILEWYRKFARKINAVIGDEDHPVTDIYDPNDYLAQTITLPEWMVEIFDQNGESVYYEPLFFSKVTEDDPGKQILYIGRRHGENGDIQIRETWAGAQYIGRDHAYLIYDSESESITLYENEAKNYVYDKDGNRRSSIVIEDGTEVTFADVIRLQFRHLGMHGVADAIREKEAATDPADPAGSTEGSGTQVVSPSRKRGKKITRIT